MKPKPVRKTEKKVSKTAGTETDPGKRARQESASAPSAEEKAKAKAARKAEKASKKADVKAVRKKSATAGDPAPALSDEEKAKIKAARKIEKRAKKAEAKADHRKEAGRDGAPLTDEEKAKAKAERKAKKAAAKVEAKAIDRSEVKGKKPSAPVLSEEEKAKAKAERKAQKAAAKTAAKSPRRKKAKDESPSAPVLSDEEKAKAKAERKTKKAEAKSARRSKTKDKSPPAPVLSDEEKAKAKAERKTKKAEAKSPRGKKAKGESPSAPVLSAEEKAKAKAERKAEKAAAKAGAKSTRRGDAKGKNPSAPALSEEEKAKAKTQRKAQKAEAKSLRRGKVKGESPSAPVLSDEEKAQAKAERKAKKAAAKVEAKAAHRSEVKSKDPSAPVLSDEEKAKAIAQRKAEKAKKKAEAGSKAKGENPSAPALSEEEKAKVKAQRKAEKAAKKAETKAGRKGAAADSAPALSDEEKAKAKAARKAQKAERKNQGEDGNAGDGSEGRQRSERRRRRAEGDDEGEDAGERVLRLALHGLTENSAARLRGSIEATLTAAGAPFEWAKEDDKPGLAIYAFENPPAVPEEIASRIGDIAKDRAKFRIFVGRAGDPAPDGSIPFVAENKAIAMLASEGEDAFLDVASLFRRYGNEALQENGEPTDAGYAIIANAVLAIAASGRLPKVSVPYPQRLAPADLVEARALAPADILSQLNWNDPSPPKLLWTHASKESVEAFMDGKIVLSPEQTLDLTLPIAWPAEVADRAAGIQVLGLEFLSGPLNFWYARAGSRSTEKIKEIDAFLKERGATAGEILARAGKIIVDFADAHPLSSSAAWEENAVSRRARVLALFVLCCKLASKRKVKFDEAVLLRVYGELLNLIEVLRVDDFYTPGSFDGVGQDSLLIGLALTLRRTAYAELLLKDSIARLVALQLNVGLTGEGVWRTGPFSDHCSLLSQFKIIIVDFDKADMALIEPVALAAKKMTVFAEAMLKSDGSPPAFDDSRDNSFLKKLSGTRRALAGAGFSKTASPRGKTLPRVTDTYVFREAQYFASHSTQKPSPDSSLVILHAEPASASRRTPGGAVLAFARGDADLLICVEPPEGTKKRDKAAHHDPALRNGYHINDVGYAAEQEIQLQGARLIKSWRGPDWAAAKSIDETNPAGSIKRVVLHLKAQHALIVVDELVASDGNEAAFEQFWHVAPGLTPTESGGGPLRFTAPETGGLTIAFDAPGATTIEPEPEDGHCVRRTMRLANGVVASLFQWTEAPVPAALTVERGALGDWSILLSGGGFDARLSLAGDELRYQPQAAG